MEAPTIVSKVEKLRMPAGTYFIGDPCYPFSDNYDDWDQIGAKTDWFTRSSWCMHQGGIVWGESTAYGDGSYEAETGEIFAVDAGLIGVVSKEAWANTDEKFLRSCGMIKTFAYAFEVYKDEDDTFFIDEIEIPTRDEGEGW